MRLALFCGRLWLALCLFSAPAWASREVLLGMLKENVPSLTGVPQYLRAPATQGIAGAQLGILDANQAGKFLKLHYQLNAAKEDQTALVKTAQQMWQQGVSVFLIDASTPTLLAVRQALPEEALLINTNNSADNLRVTLCLANTLHTAPSDSMKSDAIAQWLRQEKLLRILLISGQSEPDLAIKQAVLHSIEKYGLKLIDDKTWTFDTDLRRQASVEVKRFTQSKEYDVVWVNDTQNLFGQYIAYNTWLPRFVVGTHGLRAEAWHRSLEEWAAAQLQERFYRQNQRYMEAADYNAWVAIQAVHSALRTQPQLSDRELTAFLIDPQFEFAAYKGRAVSFRGWNGQLRQPIPLSTEQALVASLPLDGYLHPLNNLDTLGTDEPASQCQLATSIKRKTP